MSESRNKSLLQDKPSMQLVAMLLLLGVSSAMSDTTIELLATFESQLTERGVEFRPLDDGRYEVLSAAGPVTVALDNLSREYARDKDPAAVGRFLDSVLAAHKLLPELGEARAGVLPIVEGLDLEVSAATITKTLSDEVRLILVHFDEAAGLIRFLRTSDADAWGSNAEDLWAIAEANLDSIMQRTEVTYLDAGGFQLGVIEAEEPYKASLIRARSLRNKVEDELGWPIYAVAPSRGFVFLLSKSDADKLGNVGTAVVKEFRSAEHPISTEVWEVGDAGITTIGSFPSD